MLQYHAIMCTKGQDQEGHLKSTLLMKTKMLNVMIQTRADSVLKSQNHI